MDFLTGRTKVDGSGSSALTGRGLAVLFVGTFILGVDGFVLSGLLPQVASSLHVSIGTAGQLTTLFALVYAVGSPIIAATAGRWDRRVLLAAGMVVFIGGVTLQAVGTTFVLVAVGRAIAALGAAGYQATAYSTAGVLSNDANRPRALAVVAGGSSVALVAGLPLGIVIGQAAGWRAALWVLVGLAVLSLLLVALLPEAHAPQLSLRQRVSALGDRRVLAILAGTVTTMTPGFVVLAYVPSILQRDGVLVVIAVLAFGCGQVAGTALVARMIARYGGRAAALLGASVVTVACIVLSVTRTMAAPAVVTMAVLGLGVGFAIVPAQARLFRTVPALASVAVGLNGSAIYIGSAVGAAAGGVALEVGGHAVPTVVAAIVGVVAVVIVTLLVPERMRAAGPGTPSS